MEGYGCVVVGTSKIAVMGKTHGTDRFCPECKNLLVCRKYNNNPQRYVCENGCGKSWTRYKVSTTEEKNLERERGNRWLKRQRAKLRQFIDALKDEPCADCGNRFPSVCMDFDHVRGQKKFNISSVVGTWSSYSNAVQMIVEEIAKCDVVCANCHRIRHQKRRCE